MIKETEKLLKQISFRDMKDWNIKQLAGRSAINSKYNKMVLGKCLCRKKERLTVQDNQKYGRITIRTNHGGIGLRDRIWGKEIKTKKQCYIHTGQLAVSKIDARNGAFGIVPPEAEGAIITDNFWVYDVEEKLANKKYLVLLFSSREFVRIWEACSNGSGNRLYLQEKSFLDYPIPVPDREEQDALIGKYEAKMKAAKRCEEQAEKLEWSGEKDLFESLGIEKPTRNNREQSAGVLHTVRACQLSRWGVESVLGGISPGELLRSRKFGNVPLGDWCEINPGTEYPEAVEDISFLPMECISDLYGEILERREGKTFLSRGYTKFQEDDVLFAKITPCMQNGKCAVATGLKNGFGYGSTEYHVLRSKKEKALPEYIHGLLRIKALREAAQAYFTGSAGQQRVGEDFLRALTIPDIPVRSENDKEITQEKIVIQMACLKERIKALRQQAEELRRSAQSEFEEEVFG